jgi:hypothetical protein
VTGIVGGGGGLIVRISLGTFCLQKSFKKRTFKFKFVISISYSMPSSLCCSSPNSHLSTHQAIWLLICPGVFKQSVEEEGWAAAGPGHLFLHYCIAGVSLLSWKVSVYFFFLSI